MELKELLRRPISHLKDVSALVARLERPRSRPAPGYEECCRLEDQVGRLLNEGLALDQQIRELEQENNRLRQVTGQRKQH